MYFDIVKMQMVAGCFLILIIVEYFRYRRLPLLSSKFFIALLGFSILNLALDFTTAYTIMHLDTIPVWINRIFNTLYYISFIGIMASLYFYVDFFGREQRRETKAMLFAKVLPAFCGFIGLWFINPHYYFDGSKLYTYGTAVWVSAVFCGTYMVMICFSLFTKEFSLGKMIRIVSGLGLWVLLMLIQILMDGVLLAAFANTVLVFSIYCAVENPLKHIDQATNCYNEKALKHMIDEVMQYNKASHFIHIHIDNYDKISSRIGVNSFNKIIQNITSTYVEKKPFVVFRRSANSFVLIAENNEIPLEEKIQNITSYVSRAGDFAFRFHMDIIASSAIEMYKDLQKIMDYQNYSFSYADKRIVRYVDSSIMSIIERKDKVIELLNNAINKKGFEVYYQPIYSTKTNSFFSAEALVRMKDDTTIGYVSPQEFIPLAEREGLAGALGSIMFAKVCEFLTDERVRAMNLEYMDVNLSPIQCTNKNLYKELYKTIEDNNLNPEWINFEVTEAAVIENGTNINNMMNELRQYGCKFSLDDFGTAYSNPSVLAKNDYHVVKIDKSLLWPCFSSNNAEANRSRMVLKSVVDLIFGLGSDIVAEGIENVEQFNLLKEMGVSNMQGYFFAKPMNDRDFIEFLSKQAHAKTK